ncbi:MAG: threonyl-tRNA synthetase [Gammaproteobacteria bacterium]|nr:threonyl-tRNA synthetase [Gammaproteobacteria bacterium]
MPVVTLPDGSQRPFDHPVTVDEVAANIGAGLRKAALAGRVDGKLVDTSYVIDHDAKLAIVTEKDPDGIDVIRHSTAHLLAQAVKELFPDAQVTIGPVIEDGFYYDFSYKRPFTTEDLAAIEAKMSELVKADQRVSRRVMARDEAVKFFTGLGEIYKAEIIASIPEKDEISLYGQGNWVDLCRGPHVPSTGKLKAFKLMKVAGAYWRGDSRNEMLQRIYGTAWADKKQLDEYLHRLEEAEKRDHRRIGRDLDLFHMQEEAPGAVFWHPKGWAVFQTLIAYMRQRQGPSGYHEVNGPELMDMSLWEQSGHAEKFGENMYVTRTPDDRVYAIKPMNCPGHVQIFKQGLTSYRDLPVRLAEFGKVHRYEPSGALHGLMRVRAFTQDDAHVFCTEEQVTAESVAITKLLLDIYRDFGFEDVRVKFADRPPKRVGDDAVWDRAEAALKAATAAAGIEYTLNPGEGAFYGPKLEFVLKDAIGRDWQCGTLQVDFNMPVRLGAYYIDEHSTKRTPVMLHRAIFGSLERFLAILLEHHAGRLPAWLAPVQAVVLGITDRQEAYVKQITETLKNQGFRVEFDLRNEKVGFKIREHTLQRVPYLLVAGDKEVAANLISVRTRSGKDLGTMTPETFAERLRIELDSRGRQLVEG